MASWRHDLDTSTLTVLGWVDDTRMTANLVWVIGIVGCPACCIWRARCLLHHTSVAAVYGGAVPRAVVGPSSSPKLVRPSSALLCRTELFLLVVKASAGSRRSVCVRGWRLG